ncbi:hypothetical protein T484DRAFT_1837644 [Baffinella frigidus]|nr:hypothetical protein T484DRAFT_1837644 [Cryptophyta sp. CCMP2293]
MPPNLAAKSVENALGLVKGYDVVVDCSDNVATRYLGYDVVVDCSDNVATRYLVSDACVLAGKPLVSGSALRLEGQLTVYNYEGGPCYRCVFPEPPPPESVTDCSDGGVVGPVVGVIGSLQAMEVIKVAMRKPKEEVMSGRLLLYDASCWRLLLYDASCWRLLLYDASCCTFRNIRLRARRPDCAIQLL